MISNDSRRARAVLWGFLPLAVTVPVHPARAAESAPASQAAASAPTAAQFEQIRSATQPQALIDLARRFVFLRQEAAARLCVEKACLADPSLLTDSKPVSPRSWRKFWYSYRAVLRTRKLAPSDAAGRVAIAQWLNEAGERGEARRMLRAALEINPELEAARTLAKTWKLDSGGPFRFDLTYGLVHPLLLDSFSDEGEKIELRHDRTFMLLPFTYDPAEGPLRVLKNSVQVIADDNQRGRVLGIVLMALDPGAGVVPAPGAGVDPSRLTLPEQPLWERIQVTRKDDGTLDLVASNLTRPPGKRTTGRPRTAAERKAAVPTVPEAGPSVSQQASGYAAFLVDMPLSMQTIEAVYEDYVRVGLETRFLEVLGRPLSEMSAHEQAEFVDRLAEKVLAPNPLIASAAVGKVNLLRRSLKPGVPAAGSVSPGGEREDSIEAKIDQTLWRALGSTDPAARHGAFEAMVLTERPLGPTLLAALRDPAQSALTMVMLDKSEQILMATPTTGGPGGAESLADAGTAAAAAPYLKELGLEMSSAPRNVFELLHACLTSFRPEIVQRALDIILTDGSEQAVATLVDLPADGRAVLADRLGQVTDPALKAALVRVLLTRPDPTLLEKLLDACRDMRLVITGPKDPVLNAFTCRVSIEAQVRLVELLGRSDLSAVAGSEVLGHILTSLAIDAQREPKMQEALLKLARAAFDEPYQMPLGSVHRTSAAETRPGSFAGLLARIATMPNAEPATARSAAAALLAAGRVAELQEMVKLMASAMDRARLVAGVGACQELWTLESLPMFLAGALSDADGKPVVAALTALADLYKQTDPKQRWRLNLAVKLGIEPPALVKWTAATDDKVARLATSLLRQIAQMSPAESDEFEAATDLAVRQQFIVNFEKKRSEEPAGRFACMAYVDLKDAAAGAATPAYGSAAPPAEEGTGRPMLGIPLFLSSLSLQKEGQNLMQIMANGRFIGMPDERGSLAPTPGLLRLDAAPLLLDGLKWAYEQKQPFATRVDRLALSNRVKCDLHHLRLGTWWGAATVDQPRAPDPGVPLQIASLVLFLEPVADQPAPQKETRVEEK